MVLFHVLFRFSGIPRLNPISLFPKAGARGRGGSTMSNADRIEGSSKSLNKTIREIKEFLGDNAKRPESKH